MLHRQGIEMIKHANLLQRESGEYICMPIMYAISWGAQADVVEWMCVCTGLEYVEDLLTPWNGYNPLHLAVFGNHFHLIPYLLTIMPESRHAKSTKDGKFGSGKGMTPLEYARRLGYKKCAKLMADLDRKHERQKCKPKITMINDFCDDSNWPQTSLKHCKAMLRKDPAALNRSGGSLRSLPILYAIRFKARLNVVKFICIQMGEEKVKSWRGDYGWTLLHLVTFNNSIAILPYILYINPQAINVKDNQGFKPFDIARRYNHHVCAQLLGNPDKAISTYKSMTAELEIEKLHGLEGRGKERNKKKSEVKAITKMRKKNVSSSKKKKKKTIRPLTAIHTRHRHIKLKTDYAKQFFGQINYATFEKTSNYKPLTAIGARRRRHQLVNARGQV
eukprot:g6398.t1